MKLNEIYAINSRGMESIIVNALKNAYDLSFDDVDRCIQKTHIPREYGKLAKLLSDKLNEIK